MSSFPARPNQAFLDWAKATFSDSGLLLVDVGYGAGGVADPLREAGLRVSDMNHELFANLGPERKVLFFARPLGDCAMRAMLHVPNAERAFWFGEAKDLETDLGRCHEPHSLEYKLVPELRESVGVGDIFACEIRCVPRDGSRRDLQEWVLAESGSSLSKDNLYRSAHWVRRRDLPDDTRHLTLLEHARTTDVWWLDPTRTSRWQRFHVLRENPNLGHGWLTPDGAFYGCAYHEHDQVLYDYLHKTHSEIEREGWVRVSMTQEPSFMDERGCRAQHIFQVCQPYEREERGSMGRLTKEQAQKLLSLGFVVPQYLLDTAEPGWVWPDEVASESSGAQP